MGEAHPWRQPDAQQGAHAMGPGCGARLCRAGGWRHVWDVDGNRYLDFPMALGPVLLGIATRPWTRRSSSSCAAASLHASPSIEIEVAERIAMRAARRARAVRQVGLGCDQRRGAPRARHRQDASG